MATEILNPNGIGAETSLNKVSHAWEHWELVSDTSDSTYVANDQVASYQRDLYLLPASSGNGTINFIKIYLKCKEWIDGGLAKPALRSNSTVTDGTEIALTDSYVIYSQQWNTNPADAGAWAWADIDALQIGISLKAGGTSGHLAYCSKVYVEIDYTPPPPPVPVTDGDLIGIGIIRKS